MSGGLLCANCGVEKILGGTCKYCKSIRDKKYRSKNADEISKKKKAYYEANSSSIKNQQKTYRQLNAESISAKQKEWAIKNSESIKARQKAYRSLNAASIKDKQNEWWLANSQARREWKREYVEKLSDGYIASILGLKVKEITPELLALKQEQLSIHRLARQLKEKVNESSTNAD
jgi:hypothetical protein